MPAGDCTLYLMLNCNGSSPFYWPVSSSFQSPGLRGESWGGERLLCLVPLVMMLRLLNTGRVVKMKMMMMMMVIMVTMMMMMTLMMMHRALLTSEGLLDLLVASPGHQTGRCLSLRDILSKSQLAREMFAVDWHFLALLTYFVSACWYSRPVFSSHAKYQKLGNLESMLGHS